MVLGLESQGEKLENSYGVNVLGHSISMYKYVYYMQMFIIDNEHKPHNQSAGIN